MQRVMASCGKDLSAEGMVVCGGCEGKCGAEVLIGGFMVSDIKFHPADQVRELGGRHQESWR